MFSYVEEMRKWGLSTMSKIYGVPVKQKGQGSNVNINGQQEDGSGSIVQLDDVYPLHKLVDILCYQDLDKSRAACQHYSLSVVDDHSKEDYDHSKEYSNQDGGPVVSWKESCFKEPRDAKNGAKNGTKNPPHLPLKPRKIVHTIEAKLQGATRLTIFRGQVSGSGVTLDMNSSTGTAAVPRRMTVATTTNTPRPSTILTPSMPHQAQAPAGGTPSASTRLMMISPE
jgi:hypothetical protein